MDLTSTFNMYGGNRFDTMENNCIPAFNIHLYPALPSLYLAMNNHCLWSDVSGQCYRQQHKHYALDTARKMPEIYLKYWKVICDRYST